MYNAKWNYHGHNSYYQGLSELGVVGSIPYLAFLTASLLTSIRFIRSDAFAQDAKYLLYYACYIQMMYIVYALTGNPIYTGQYIVQMFFSVGAAACLGRKYMNLMYGCR